MSRSSFTTRRDFLRGKAVAASVGDRPDSGRSEASGAGTALAPDVPPPTDSLIHVTRRAMACQFQIALPATQPAALETAYAALDVIDELEDQMTVYRDSSEVSRINLLAATTAVPVEGRLFDLFETALDVTAETDGAFDIAAGALVKAWGFFRGPKRVPDPQELARVMERIGSRHLKLDRVARTIAFSRPGVELNLGAIGKGYALDRAAELFKFDRDVPSALLHGGQSSVLAIGSFDGCDASSKGWLVAIGHPHRPGEPIATVRLKDCALGTSGATIQFFELGGRRFGHILDPRTGYPASGQTCVSVIAPTSALADALSTAFFILGADNAREYCDRHPDVGAVVVSPDEPDGKIRVSRIGRARDHVELSKGVNGN